MRFPYYQRLTKGQQRIYRASDAVSTIALPRISALEPLVDDLQQALGSEQQRQVSRSVKTLTAALLAQLGVPPVGVRVLAARPASDESELHGLYEREDDGSAVLTVWMRTAAKHDVVAFRTFLRTLLHELCHHLDYEHLKLADTYHTQGFFRRESSLARQLTGPSERGAPKAAAPGQGEQLELPFLESIPTR